MRRMVSESVRVFNACVESLPTCGGIGGVGETYTFS